MTDPIIIFSLSTCSHCKEARKLLDKLTISYSQIDVDLLGQEEREAVLHDLKRLNPRASFPTILIGEKVIAGFREKEIMAELKLIQPVQPHPIKRWFSRLVGRK